MSSEWMLNSGQVDVGIGWTVGGVCNAYYSLQLCMNSKILKPQRMEFVGCFHLCSGSQSSLLLSYRYEPVIIAIALHACVLFHWFAGLKSDIKMEKTAEVLPSCTISSSQFC